MYKSGRLIKGRLYVKTWNDEWITLKALVQANRKAV